MKRFKKWHSIENSYRTKEINYYRAVDPDLDGYTYVITEKLHGANVSFHFESGMPWMIARRNGFLQPGESFNDIENLVEKYRAGLEIVQNVVDLTGNSVRLYGEIYGAGVQKGVNYGDERRIAFFGMKEGDVLMPFWAFKLFLPDELPIVPIVGEVDNLQAALDFDTDFISKVGSTLCEGIVIQPLNCVVFDSQGSPFLLKKKNEKFLEANSAKKERVIDPTINDLQQEVTGYVTDMRLQSIFSKAGEIERPDQIGEYIRLMVEDITEDFEKDCDEFADMDKGQRGQVLKVVGKLTVGMLKEYL